MLKKLRLEEEQIERKKTMEKMEKIAEINKQLFEEKTEVFIYLLLLLFVNFIHLFIYY